MVGVAICNFHAWLTAHRSCRTDIRTYIAWFNAFWARHVATPFSPSIYACHGLEWQLYSLWHRGFVVHFRSHCWSNRRSIIAFRGLLTVCKPRSRSEAYSAAVEDVSPGCDSRKSLVRGAAARSLQSRTNILNEYKYDTYVPSCSSRKNI